MKHVDLYTDGACSGNPGKGGYGGILMCNGHTKEYSGYDPMTTNNRMELLAVIKGLQTLKEVCEVDLYSDSQYVVDAFNKGWITSWQEKGWKTANKSPVKNVDLWETLLALVDKHKVNFIKVKGHADNEYNNRCDKIAVEEYKKLQV